MMPLGPAIVILTENKRTHERPAAMVFRTATGIGWMEPGYFDEQIVPRPQWHERGGIVFNTPNGVQLVDERCNMLVLDADRVKGNPDLDSTTLRPLFDWLEERLKQIGTTLAEQRLVVASKVPGIIG